MGQKMRFFPITAHKWYVSVLYNKGYTIPAFECYDMHKGRLFPVRCGSSQPFPHIKRTGDFFSGRVKSDLLVTIAYTWDTRILKNENQICKNHGYNESTHEKKVSGNLLECYRVLPNGSIEFGWVVNE